MADTLARTSPLHGWEQRFAELPSSVVVAEEPFVAMVDLRVDPTGPGAAAARSVLGRELPTTPSTWTGTEEFSALWLGPDEWLVTSPSAPARDLEADLAAAVGAHAGTATDVSAQRTTVRLSGSRARDVLAKGCSIDLHPRAFGVGSAVQTMLGMAGVVLLALDDAGTDYRILVRSSFARYLAEWLIDAAEEFGADW
jgi:sarcosine oxidase, subunit gamma